MSVRPDPRQFGRRDNHAGWTLRERIELRERMKARRIAWASCALFCIGIWVAIGCTFADVPEGVPVLLVVIAFSFLVLGIAAAEEA
jgi:hypothetical protein